MKYLLLALCFIFLTLFYFVWREKAPVQAKPIPPPAPTRPAPGFFSIHIPPTKLLLYEGLPHQELEPAALASERKSKSTVMMHGYYFYAQPVELKPEDEAWLRIWAASDVFDRSDFYANGCLDAFHPDFALVWKDQHGEDIYLGLCFRCQEMKYSGKDLFPDAGLRRTEELKKHLNAYHVNWKGK